MIRDFIGGGFLLAGIACFVLASLGASVIQAPWLVGFGVAFMLIGYPVLHRRR